MTKKNLNPNGVIIAKGLSDSNAHDAAKSKTHLPAAGFGRIFLGGAPGIMTTIMTSKNLNPNRSIMLEVLSNVKSVHTVAPLLLFWLPDPIFSLTLTLSRPPGTMTTIVTPKNLHRNG